MKRASASLLMLVILATVSPAADVPGITVDKDKKTVKIDAKIAPRKLTDEAFKGEIYPIEVIASWAFPKGKKAHETVVTFDVKPSDVHKALESAGATAGKPIVGDVAEKVSGSELNVYIEVPGDGETKKIPLDKALLDPKTKKPMPKVKWYFTGSLLTKPDPNKDEKVYAADITGTLITVFPVTGETVLQSSLTMKEEKYLKLETNKEVLPKEGTAVKLVIEVLAEKK